MPLQLVKRFAMMDKDSYKSIGPINRKENFIVAKKKTTKTTSKTKKTETAAAKQTRTKRSKSAAAETEAPVKAEAAETPKAADAADAAETNAKDAAGAAETTAKDAAGTAETTDTANAAEANAKDAAGAAEAPEAAGASKTKAAAKKTPAKAAKTTKTTKTAAASKTAAKPAAKSAAKTAKSTAKAAKQDDAEALPTPRRSIAFIGSECYPFVKTGGLGDVMYALPKALTKQNCDVKVILPRYKCIPQEYQEKMVYKGSFDMDLCADGTRYYVGIMEYVWDGVVYDFIDNEFFFTAGNPYTNLADDIPKFCYFGKAALAALNYLNWTPDVIHCHDWQAGLVPVYLREMFSNTPLARSKVILTIHNLRFQGKYDIQMISYWSNLPMHLFNKDVMKESYDDANMMKGGLTYSNLITTVSATYAGEIQTPEYGENLDAHLRYHSGKLRGIVNGIDYDIWNPATDKLLEAPYSQETALKQKQKNKLALQKELGLDEDENRFVIGLISRLTNQKGLDLVNAIMPQLIDGNTQVVVLGTGDPQYEDSFRYYENTYKGSVCSNIMYDESRSHRIYASADAFLVPSQFEPCGLTQLIAMHYGTIPIVRETGGLKDTVLPYNQYTNEGNGFSFDRYETGLLLDAINRAKTLFFTERERWDEMVLRDMQKDVSWENSAKQYRQMYVDLTT